MHHQLVNNQSIELSSSSEIDNIIQEAEEMGCFCSPTLGPRISDLILGPQPSTPKILQD